MCGGWGDVVWWCMCVVGGVWCARLCGVGVMYVQGSALPVQSNKNGSIRFSKSVEWVSPTILR